MDIKKLQNDGSVTERNQRRGGVSKTSLCIFCQQRFEMSDQLQSHLRTKHRQEALAAGMFGEEGLKMIALGEVLQVIFEDSWIAVVVKPQGVPTLGAGSFARADWLLKQLIPSKELDALSQPTPAHRLDSGTGGLLVVAKSKTALQVLSNSFAVREIRKRYRALVRGRLEEDTKGVIDSPIQGKPAVTRYASTAPPVWTSSGWVSTVDLWPQDGRRHQLRRHLAEQLGLPILGDTRYGGRGAAFVAARLAAEDTPVVQGRRDDDEERPLYLWALEMSLPHPILADERVSVLLQEPRDYMELRGFSVPVDSSLEDSLVEVGAMAIPEAGNLRDVGSMAYLQAIGFGNALNTHLLAHWK